MFRRFASTSTSTFRLPPTIRQLLANSSLDDSQTITVSGWIKSIRKQKNVAFAVLTDGSSAKGLQAVFTGQGEGLKELTNGAAVRLTGKLVPSPGAGQEKELLVNLDETIVNSICDGAQQIREKGKVQILGKCDPETYPIQKKALSPEYLRNNVHLRARTDPVAAMIRLRNGLRRNIGTFFDDQGFVYTDTPILTGSDAEGAGEAFEIAKVAGEHPAALSPATSSSTLEFPAKKPSPVDFFSRPAYLTVSHQLHLEALATALSRVYTLAPCFRAEPSLTGRHLAEFWMLEAEWAFGTADISEGQHLKEVCEFVESSLRNVVRGLLTDKGGDIDVLWKGGDEVRRRSLEAAFSSPNPWTRMTYTSAIKALEDHHNSASPSTKFKYEPKWGRPLQSEHERWIAEILIAGPVFITDYPLPIKPFYMRVNNEGSTVACFDLIVPHVGELVGGSVREERIDMMGQREDFAFLSASEAYKWYFDLRKHGGAPHAGFGMGFERLVSWIGGIDNIRECVPMPRWAGRMLL